MENVGDRITLAGLLLLLVGRRQWSFVALVVERGYGYGGVQTLHVQSVKLKCSRVNQL